MKKGITSSESNALRPRKKAVRHFDPDPLNPPPILTTRQLAMLLKSTPSTVYAWSLSDPAFLACIVRSTKRSRWWSLQRLRDAGYLVNKHAGPVPDPHAADRVIFNG